MSVKNRELISKLILQFCELEEEVLTLLSVRESHDKETHVEFINNVLDQVKNRISVITTQFSILYKQNESFKFNIKSSNQESDLSGDLLVLNILNNLIFRLILNIVNSTNDNFEFKMLLLNKLCYDPESISKRLSTVSDILSIKDKENE